MNTAQIYRKENTKQKKVIINNRNVIQFTNAALRLEILQQADNAEPSATHVHTERRQTKQQNKKQFPVQRDNCCSEMK